MFDKAKFRESEIGAGQASGVAERRRADRFEAAFDVCISMAADNGRRFETEAWVRDVSANGLGICCAEGFSVGDAVTVRTPGKSLWCEVRHCHAEGALFVAGLEVLSSSDGTDIQVSLRDLSRALHFSSRTSEDSIDN